MSRTDKDRPYWVRVQDESEPRQAHHEHQRFGRVSHTLSGKIIEVADHCTIDEPTRGNGPYGYNWEKPCTYHLSWAYSYYNVDRYRRRAMYWGPLRMDESMTLRKAVKQYNSTGEVDDDFFLQENHHHSCYGGGYWD